MNIYICIIESLYCTSETQHCKSTVLQLNILKLKKDIIENIFNFSRVASCITSSLYYCPFWFYRLCLYLILKFALILWFSQTYKKTGIERDTCTPMFITALFIIARTWKQPRCPSADEWIRKLWYIYTMEYYSAVKKNTFESVLMRWMKLEPIVQSEVSQKEKHQYSILTHIYGI